MELDALWSGVLTIAVGACAWIVRAMYAELQRLQVLLNRTREEIARDCVTWDRRDRKERGER